MNAWKSCFVVCAVILVGVSWLHASTDCFSTITGTKGPNAISYCITANGNILQVKGEGLSQQGNFEGYEVKVVDPFTGDTTSYYDYGISGSGFNAPVIVQPNGANTFPLKITRTSSFSPSITLEQNFRKDALDPSIVLVEMKVTFFQDFPRVHIDMTRATDITADQDAAGTVKTVGLRSLLGAKPGGHGLLVSALSTVDDFTESLTDECFFASHAPAASGVASCVSYNMLLPHHEWNGRTCCDAFGASRKVTFEYKLF